MNPSPESTNRIDVAYVAHLARLHLTPEETERFQGQLEQVLAYVRELDAIDVSGVEPTSHAVPVQNVLREDATLPCLDRAEVLANAPAQRHDQFLVPRILE